jgi:hypothetical protein
VEGRGERERGELEDKEIDNLENWPRTQFLWVVRGEGVGWGCRVMKFFFCQQFPQIQTRA